MIVNGDTYFAPSAIAEIDHIISSESNQSVLFGSRSSDYQLDDIKVHADAHGGLLAVSKTLDPAAATMRSAGCFLSRAQPDALYSYVESVVRKRVDEPRTWHECLNVLVKNGIPILTYQIDPNSWCEVDTVADMEQLKEVQLVHSFNESSRP
jgi:choline kinase